MKMFRVVAPFAGVNHGLVVASPEQARSRAHALKHVEGDTYEVTSQTGFKRGEEFGFDGDMPRALALQVEELEGNYEPQLEDMDREQLLAMAKGLGLNPHVNTGSANLIKAIKKKQDELLEEQEASQRQARLAELEDKDPTELTPEETEELNQLKAQE